MLTKRIAVGLLIALVAGLLSVTLPNGISSDAAQASTATIKLGDFWFGAAANQAPVGQPEPNIATISGAATGEITLVFENVGQVEHEVMVLGLFPATTEAVIKSFDANGNEVSKIETVSSLREVELQPGMRAEVTLVLDESIIRSFQDDPNLELKFEIACQVGHGTGGDHYKAGMRGFITLKA